MINSNPSYADLLAALRSPYYGLTFLNLANRAYTAEGQPDQIATLLQQGIETAQYMPPLPALGQQGSTAVSTITPLPGKTSTWTLEWGPSETVLTGNANMCYIASYKNPDGIPYCYVVGIRGTDVEMTSAYGKFGILVQIIEDGDYWQMTPYAGILNSATTPVTTPETCKIIRIPNPAQQAPATFAGKISVGMALGLGILTSGTAKLRYLSDYDACNVAQALLTLQKTTAAQYKNPQPVPVVVVGHSLGGGLTQVVAPYLQWQLGADTPVIGHAYAPPTAGDQNFANSFTTAAPGSCYWFNQLDIVPQAYSNMEWAVANLWGHYKWPENSFAPPGTSIAGQTAPGLPWYLRVALEALIAEISPAGYSRPATGQMPLNGAIPTPAQIQQLLSPSGPPYQAADVTGLKGVGHMALGQHNPFTYAAQMEAQYPAQMVYFPVTSCPGS